MRRLRLIVWGHTEYGMIPNMMRRELRQMQRKTAIMTYWALGRDGVHVALESDVQTWAVISVQCGVHNTLQGGLASGADTGSFLQSGVQAGLQTGIQTLVQTGVQTCVQTGLQSSVQCCLEPCVQVCLKRCLQSDVRSGVLVYNLPHTPTLATWNCCGGMHKRTLHRHTLPTHPVGVA